MLFLLKIHPIINTSMVYRYSKYTKLTTWTVVCILALTLGLAIFSIIRAGHALSALSFLSSTISICIGFYFRYTSQIEIDETTMTFSYFNRRKVVIDITKVDRVARHFDSKKRVRYLMLSKAFAVSVVTGHSHPDK